MNASTLTIRHCTGTPEFQECLALQREVWGFSDEDLVPVRMFVVAAKIGGQVLGAFDGERLAGFLLSIPGSRAGHAYLHSHMLAVREQYRDSGLGQRLKHVQRDDAIARGFDLIEWTFDPLEIKNAYLNLVRLGAIARRYTINQYGASSSPLQGGLPTDRLVAEWWLRSGRVRSVLDRNQRPEQEIEMEIRVPAEIYEWKASLTDRIKAKELQSENREAFLAAFKRGLSVLDYRRERDGSGAFLLGRWNEDWSYASE